MFVDLDWPLNASSLLSASAELLVLVPSMRPQLTLRSVDFRSVHLTTRFGGRCVPLGSIHLIFQYKRQLCCRAISRCGCWSCAEESYAVLTQEIKSCSAVSYKNFSAWSDEINLRQLQLEAVRCEVTSILKVHGSIVWLRLGRTSGCTYRSCIGFACSGFRVFW